MPPEGSAFAFFAGFLATFAVRGFNRKVRKGFAKGAKDGTRITSALTSTRRAFLSPLCPSKTAKRCDDLMISSCGGCYNRTFVS